MAGYDAAVAWQKSEHEDYTNIYVNEYLQLMAAHGGLYTQGASAIDGPLTKEELYSYIHKRSITYDAEGKIVIGEFVDGISKKEDGYYHLIQDHYGNNSLGSTDHTMTTHLHLAEVRIIPLEYSKKCKGRNCTDMHRTSYEAFSTHFVSCKDYHTDSFTDACRDTWYTCDSNHKNEEKDHQVSTCIKFIQVSLNEYRGCNATFKTCLRVVIDHNLTDANARGTQHSATSVYEGENRMHACNIHDTSVPGDHSSTWLCNESPCSNRQVPYCFDQCPEAGNHGTTTDDSLVVCTISGCQDSTSYDPTSSSAGLHAYCNECYQYKCNGVDHSWQTSCSDTAHTNTNGDSCQASGFYECVSHTPVYPAPPPPTTVSCGGCSVSYDPQGSLAWRHEYIPCPRTRIAHDLACGGSFYRCSNTNTCIWGWRHSSWNDDPEL